MRIDTRKASYLRGRKTMGKYIAFGVIILVALFFVEFLEIYDIPYFDVPDFTGSRDAMFDASEERMKQRFGD